MRGASIRKQADDYVFNAIHYTASRQSNKQYDVRRPPYVVHRIYSVHSRYLVHTRDVSVRRKFEA